ncbi:MAG TPA: UDP-N-acetylglucosamine 2-epimerase (non-hydrolyzing) [Acidimicrobiia bacterium]|nr:UDP-N-acetylglucosamine 2-epimerase (non-hydrolyzing) [Acidimicrobiia bacterium]
MRLLVPFGTRPEIVKLAPVVAALRGHGHEVRAVATGQHGDPRLADDFLADLALEPDARWALPGREADRVGALLTRAYDELNRHPVDAVVVLGDTHTVPLFGLAARRSGVGVVHLEAGLRSFNERSLEEVHRRAAAAICSLHLAPTALAASLLHAEGVDSRRVVVVGNPITDTLASFGPPRRHPTERAGAVFTAHRATNVDDPARLAAVVDCAVGLADALGTVTFPVHPRTDARLRDAGLHEVLGRHPGVLLREPLRYREMLDAVARARVVVTDSGGLQEEAAWLGVPVVVLRRSTPRWEGVLAGTTALVGVDAGRAVAAARRLADPAEQARVAAVACPYGDGRVGERVARLLDEPAVRALLTLHEPDFTGGAPPALVAS